MQGAVRQGAVPRGRVRATQRALPDSEQDVKSYATKYRCDQHLVDYYIPHGDVQRCPMCALEQKYDDVRAQVVQLDAELKTTTAQLDRYRVQVDLQTAIRSAIELLDDADYAWLKLQMYQYKVDKSVTLKVTHGKLPAGKRIARGDKLPANGFMALPRDGDPDGHICSSIGGVAMAEYLDEALTRVGSAQAMGIMLKAWWKALPGAQT